MLCTKMNSGVTQSLARRRPTLALRGLVETNSKLYKTEAMEQGTGQCRTCDMLPNGKPTTHLHDCAQRLNIHAASHSNKHTKQQPQSLTHALESRRRRFSAVTTKLPSMSPILLTNL
jgi:hypothetical protein